MFEVARSLIQELERQRVAIDVVDRHTLVLRRVPLARGHFNKLETDLLFRQPSASAPVLVCADGDLEYVGESREVAALFGPAPGAGWQMLRLPQERDETFQAVLERALAALGFGGVEPRAASLRGRQERLETPGEKLLREFGRDLTALARNGKLPPVIGRCEEIAQVQDILLKRIKNKPLLVGEAGVGKTAIVEGLAQRITRGTATPALAHCRIIEISPALLQAGAAMRGEFEQRVKDLIETAEADQNLIIFFDEIHTLLGAGNQVGYGDLANLLKPALSRGAMRVIGATTPGDYRRIERDRALDRRFAKVWVGEPSMEDTIVILQGLAPALAAHHDNCAVSQETLAQAVTCALRYLPARRLPDKAIDLVDEAMAHRRRVAAQEAGARKGEPLAISPDDIAEVVERWTGIPAARAREDERLRLLSLEQRLEARVKGQPQAIRAVADAIRVRRAAVGDTTTPVGRFLFLGPSGVGKTELAKALAAALFDDENALVRLDMSEYHDRHVAARLVGAPPGYVGYEEGGQLTEAVKRRPASVVLFDEVEKAHPEVLGLLLQILSDSRLTAGDGETVSFAHTVVILTSNLGNVFLADAAPIGFGAATGEAETLQEVDQGRSRALRRFFQPEFLGRLEVVRFEPLSPQALGEVFDLELEKLRARLGRAITLQASAAARQALLREGYSPDTGARNLQDVLRRRVLRPLSQALLRGELADGDVYAIEVDERGDYICRVVPARDRGLPRSAGVVTERAHTSSAV